MSTRTFLAGVFVLLIVVSLILFQRSGSRNARAMEVAVEISLKRFYEALASDGPSSVISTNDLRRALTDELERRQFFPSFVKVADVAIGTKAVAREQTNLLCTIHLSGGVIYGLEATGKPRKVDQSEFDNWPHSPL